MRIAQVCPYSLSVPGGVQGQVMGLARALRDMGHEARVLAPCDGPPPDSMVTSLGKSVPTTTNGSMAPIAPDLACTLRTIHALRNEGFDVLHLHEPLVPGPTVTSLLVADTPMLGTFHAAGTRTAYRHAPWIARRMGKKLKVRVAVSEDARTTAQATLGGAYEVLFNAIETNRFAHAPAFPKEGPTVLFIGRHEPRKGLAVLIDAMAYLPNDTRLWVVGHGPQTTELKALSKTNPRIEWLGRLTEYDKARRLSAADVLCAPSVGGESFGVVLLEAMAAGTPVVASDLAGYRTVARSEDEALLPPPGDTAALGNALRRVLTDKKLAASLAASGSARAEEFTMKHLAEEYVERYVRCMSDHPFMV